jgi:tRNA pseudouridine13 synthase
MSSKSATEESVGITEFVNKLPGMTGIIKHRYSDFHVHEIGLDGKIVRLETLEALPIDPLPDGFEDWMTKSTISPFFKFKLSSEQQKARLLLEYPNISYTEDKDGNVTIEKTNKRRPRYFFVTFVCCKENAAVNETIARIARKMNIEKKKIGFAGTKDKRAITTQVMSIKGLSVAQVQNLANVSEFIKCGHFSLSTQGVNLGDLKGNHFTLVLRDAKIPGCSTVDQMREELGNKMKALNEHGFINYFGLQRFGTTSTGTHTIGRAILRKEWDKVINLILSPAEGDVEGIKAIKKEFLKTRNAKKAFEKIPYSYQAERTLYKAIRNDPSSLDNPKELFRNIDLRQRKLYVHAYQSYLWNFIASSRFKEHGQKVVAGDIVDAGDKYVKVKKGEETKYSIFDIVIPLPSEGYIDEEIVPLLKADGVKPSMFSAQKELNASGDFRKLFARPDDIKYDIIEHDDRDAELIDSDLDKLSGKTNAINHVKGGAHKSAVVEFSLKQSQYATMCMRELMKRTTEWWTDSEMSNQEPKSSKWCRI